MEERLRRTLKLIGGEDLAAGTHSGSPSGPPEADLIVAINGQPLSSVDDLHRFLAEWPIGEPVVLTIMRGLERQDLRVTPGEAGQ